MPGGCRDEAMVKVYHTDKFLKAFGGGRLWELANCVDFLRQREGTLRSDAVAEEIDCFNAEDALATVNI